MKENASIIAIVGMPGAGKSEASLFFKEKNIPVLRFGDQTDIGLNEYNLPRNEKNERWYREKLRNDLGMAAMAIKIEPRINEALKSSKQVVLDGLYSWEEFIYLKKRFPSLILLCVYASPKIRYERLSKRTVRPLTFQESQARDFAEIEHLNKGGPIAISDFLIINESNKKFLVTQLETFYHLLS
jgi:dephospho-CoA kinase